eukprot:TRINITY_DN199_c0_g1_i16.p2 TRINITY_DN199_c0_g1~~TRINITY_DN199_c0_g1_i16.p2  ORF type:complete len:164 (-),score=23.46 TRINITY_DN199_c0_g1_i16:670-1161(-)
MKSVVGFVVLLSIVFGCVVSRRALLSQGISIKSDAGSYLAVQDGADRPHGCAVPRPDWRIQNEGGSYVTIEFLPRSSGNTRSLVTAYPEDYQSVRLDSVDGTPGDRHLWENVDNGDGTVSFLNKHAVNVAKNEWSEKYLSISRGAHASLTWMVFDDGNEKFYL